jgi:hypothetical protein
MAQYSSDEPAGGETGCVISDVGSNYQESEWTRLHRHLHPLPSTITLTLRLLKSSRSLRSNEANCLRPRRTRSDRMRAGSWKPSVLVLVCTSLFYPFKTSRLRGMLACKSPEDDRYCTEPLPSLSPILPSERFQLSRKSSWSCSV